MNQELIGSSPYRAVLTREPFLFSETRTAARLLSEGLSDGDALAKISSNIVPYIKKDDLEQETEIFLKQYCPEALVTPMCVPISAIAGSMGLTIVQGRCLTDDFSIFGEICFSVGDY